MKRSWIRSWAAAAATLTLAAAGAVAQPLSGEVEALIGSAGIGSAEVGVSIVDLRTGRELAAINAEDTLIPASNMKLLTSGAFLTVLGPGFRFRTEVWRDGETVWLVGSGDPALGDPELLKEMGVDADDFLDRWSSMIREAGEGPVREVVVDDRVFDREGVHPTWPVDQLNRWYCAEVSGLTFHANVLSVYASPSRGGGSPDVTTAPDAPWLRLRNMARSTSKGGNTLWVAREINSNGMTLYGKSRWALGEPIEVALHQPAMVFARILADRLADGPGSMPNVRYAAANEDARQGRLALAVETDAETVLRRCNVDSHNLYAEAMFKRLAREVTGQPGSWPTGQAVLRMVIQETLGDRLGAGSAAQSQIADGSGMSRENRVSPRLLASWLASMNEQPPEVREAFLASLPEAGADGTLRRRFRDVEVEREVRAKSGYLDGVSCLSGYLFDNAGEPRVAFSVLVNELPRNVPVRRAKELHEQIVAEAEAWLSDQFETADALRE